MDDEARLRAVFRHVIDTMKNEGEPVSQPIKIEIHDNERVIVAARVDASLLE